MSDFSRLTLNDEDIQRLAMGASGRSAVGNPLRPTEEMVFPQWLNALPWAQEFRQQYGESPNPNDSQYDYRKAWQADIAPQRYEYDENRYHWPSTTDSGVSLKGPNHPTLWAEHFMRQTGGLDPFSIGIEDPQSAQWYLQGLRPQR